MEYHGIECFYNDELNTNGEITILDDNEAFIIEENNTRLPYQIDLENLDYLHQSIEKSERWLKKNDELKKEIFQIKRDEIVTTEEIFNYFFGEKEVLNAIYIDRYIRNKFQIKKFHHLVKSLPWLSDINISLITQYDHHSYEFDVEGTKNKITELRGVRVDYEYRLMHPRILGCQFTNGEKMYLAFDQGVDPIYISDESSLKEPLWKETHVTKLPGPPSSSKQIEMRLYNCI